MSICEVHESEVQKNIIVLWPFSLHSPMHLTIFFLCSYVGRKALHWRTEKLVPGTTVLARPDYSYWTLGYLISHRGAQKLIDANPFSNLLPVDEYLPIMFNKHPEWVGWCNLRGMGKEDTMYHLSSFSHLLPLPPSLPLLLQEGLGRSLPEQKPGCILCGPTVGLSNPLCGWRRVV